MMLPRTRTGLSLWIALMLLTGTALAGEADVPLGHPDFYPSPERPVGFRGDGSGYFAGATIVTEWWEGTPKQVEQPYTDKRGRKKTDEAWVFADDRSRNIVWKTQLPAWANGHPVVVGDRVFCLGEPDYLFCLDANTGKLLWTRRCNPWAAAGVDAKTAERLQTLYDIYVNGVPQFNKMTSGGTTSNQVDPKTFKEILKIFQDDHWPQIKQTLERLAPGPGWQALLNEDLQKLQTYFDKYSSRKRPKVKSQVRRAIGKAIDKLSGPKVPIDPPWGHMIGWCASVPVSDGERVYASFGQGGVICCDLDGRVLWTAFSEPGEMKGTTTQSLQGPLLCDGVLIDPRGRSTLRGFDAQTGRLLWETPAAHPDNSKGRKGGYYVGNHAIVPLRHGAQVTRVLVTTLCNIIRPRDGKMLGYLPWPHDYGPSGGPSVMWSGNRVYRASNGDGGGCPFTGYELTVADANKIDAKIIFKLGKKGSPGYHGQVCTPDFLLMTGDFNFVSPDGSEHRDMRRFGGLSNIMAGNTFVCQEEGHRDRFLSSWGARRFDGQAFMVFKAWDATNPRAPKQVGGTRLLGGKNMPRVPAMERWAPKLYEHPKYWGQCYGKPAHLVHTDTSMFAMANRLFIKTVGHVYCIGNPQQRYAWNSASRGSSVATADGAGASTPPTPAAPAAAPESSTPQPPAAVVRKWEPPLLALVAHSVAAGEKPEFRLSSMRTTVRIVGVNDDKELELQARGMRLAYTCERLSLQEKAAIAGLVADGSSARQAAVAAFFNLAAGNEAEAARWMDRAGSYAELVKKSVAR